MSYVLKLTVDDAADRQRQLLNVTLNAIAKSIRGGRGYRRLEDALHRVIVQATDGRLIRVFYEYPSDDESDTLRVVAVKRC